MRRYTSRLLLSLSMLLIGTSATAGVIKDGVWTPTGCGIKPEAPVLNLRNDKSYNQSVNAVNVYQQNIRDYLECLTREANADIRAITESANAAPKAAA
ncbi:MAG: hypothetical protein ABUL58_07955, partial [Steroidobacter sp.]